MGLDGPLGVRHTPETRAVPNSIPAGAKTGSPPRTQLYSRAVQPGQSPTPVVSGAPPNRTVVLTAPVVNFAIYIGDGGVTVGNGARLQAGIPYYVQLVGLQDLYAVTDSPVALSLQVQVSIVLMAETERPTT